MRKADVFNGVLTSTSINKATYITYMVIFYSLLTLLCVRMFWDVCAESQDAILYIL